MGRRETGRSRLTDGCDPTTFADGQGEGIRPKRIPVGSLDLLAGAQSEGGTKQRYNTAASENSWLSVGNRGDFSHRCRAYFHCHDKITTFERRELRVQGSEALRPVTKLCSKNFVYAI